jgi:predicted phage terminase large subunit-like protein
VKPQGPTEAVDPLDWRRWPFERKRELLGQLRTVVGEGWRARARKDQLPPDGWQKFFLRGGRGSGKSWASAHLFAELIQNDPFYETDGPGRWAIVAPTFGDARDKCVESAESGLLMAFGTSVGEVEAGISPAVAKWNRSIGELQLRDGTMVHIDGADDGAYRIQGWNMRGCWADEVGLWKKWKAAWEESIEFAVRAGEAKIVISGTPKRNMPARALVRQLLDDPEVESRRLLTSDNLHNLSEAFKAQVLKHQGTELGRQELEGHLLEDVEGALWLRDWINHDRGAPHGGWQKGPIVGLDPADGTEDGAEHGIAAVALGMDHELYVLHSLGLRDSPTKFVTRGIRLAQEIGARLVVEKNHGGAWLTEVIERVLRDLGVRVPYETVHASEGKKTRAEPVAALYEQGHVHHLGGFAELEDQMCNFTGGAGEKSPDRLDALVWAMSKFTGMTFGPAPEPKVHEFSDRAPAGVHRWS